MFEVIRHKVLTILDWYQLRPKIDFAPTYQRKSDLWKPTKKSGLIDSIINGYDIPKVYIVDFAFSTTSFKSKGYRYAVVDGKQRFEAIFEFMDDRLKLSPGTILRSDLTDLSGLRYSDLVAEFPQVAGIFEAYVLDVYVINTNEARRIEEMFVRLNSGVSANGAERRNAMPGPVPPQLRKLASHRFFTRRTSFSRARMAEFNVSAKLLLLEYSKGISDIKAQNLDRFVLEMAKKSSTRIVNAAAVRVRTTLDVMAGAFPDKSQILKRSGEIPIYYLVIAANPRVAKKLVRFLPEFYAALMDNVRVLRADPERADPILSAYYTHQRTTNDQASLKGRVDILQRYLSGSARL